MGNMISKWYRNSGFVYVIQCGEQDIYKIGITTNSAFSRMNELQTGCPYKLKLISVYPVLDCQEVERICHCIFHRERLEGEWFRLEEYDIKSIIDFLWYEAGCYEKRISMLHTRGLLDTAKMARAAECLSAEETDKLLCPMGDCNGRIMPEPKYTSEVMDVHKPHTQQDTKENNGQKRMLFFSTPTRRLDVWPDV